MTGWIKTSLGELCDITMGQSPPSNTYEVMKELRINNEELPKGWIQATIDDLVSSNGLFCDGDWIESKDQDLNGKVRLIQLADIGDGIFKDKSNRHLTYEKSIELGCTYLLKDDLLIARLPDPLGRACIFPLVGNKKYVTAVDICIVRPNFEDLSIKFLLYLINSPQIRKKIDQSKSGSTRMRIARKNLAKIHLSIAPKYEQLRIVEKIEELFSELDNGVESLKKAREQLKTYRQAVLKYAFEGKMTQEWREQQIQAGNPPEPAEKLLELIKKEREVYYQKQVAEWKKACEQAEKVGSKKPAKPRKPKDLPPLTEKELDELPELPEGWGWVKLGSLIQKPKYGTSKKCDYNIKGTGVLRIPNISNGYIDPLDLKFAKFEDNELNDLKLQEGDILTIRSNGSVDLVGKCGLVGKKDKCFVYAGYLIRLRVYSEKILPKYLLNIMSSSDLRIQIVSKAKSTSGVNNINAQELCSLRIPLPPIYEQAAIISEIETRLSVCDKLEQTIEDSLKKAEALRQSILKKAFEGELTREWRLAHPEMISGENSAESLLARIREEKESLRKNSPQRPKGRKGKSNK
jgi:type I restriction enzyme, S subunit